MTLIFNKFYGIINSSKIKLSNTDELNPNITDKQFLNIIYNIANLKDLQKFILQSDKKISNISFERILEKFCIIYINDIKNNLDLFVDILLYYFNNKLNCNLNYDIIYKNLKTQLKKKHNHQIIFNIKKLLIKY